ncbi:MAG: helix-turn-helix domain-containing protein [Planctomycetota bacterium]
MAKMFYTLDEAAEKLGVDAQSIKDMAARNELQQFRDGDKLMFKRDQIDAKASSGMSDGPIPLADSGISDAIDIKADTAIPPKEENPNEATGVSVFDAGEVDMVDPMAQTMVTSASIDDEDLALESVGSGSGLLDLTRESDDTSLGAELLDEIYPGSGDTGAGGSVAMDSAVGSSGVFDGAISMETGVSGPSGLENLSGPAATTGTSASAPTSTPRYESEEFDPAGSGFGAGMMFGVMVAMVIGLLVVIPYLAGVDGIIVEKFPPLDKNEMLPLNNAYLLAIIPLVISIIFGGIGALVGKSMGSK